MFAIVCEAVPPPGSFQTATASARTIAMLRRCLLRSGPIPTSTLARGDVIRGGRGVELGQRGGLGDRQRRAHRLLERLRREAGPDPEVSVDVAPARRGALELGPQLAHEDVDAPIAVNHGVAPHALVDLLALHDLALGLREELDQLVLAARELHRDPGDEGLELIRADLYLADHDG